MSRWLWIALAGVGSAACADDSSSTGVGTTTATDTTTGAAVCDAGQGLCDGACVDVLSSLGHCGACSTPCSSADPNADVACVGGTCQLDCKTGYAFCGPLVGCKDIQNDPLACGPSCGACDVAAGEGCIGGSCQLDCESSGLTECGGHPDFCTDLETDAENCGACGVECPNGSCQDGRCTECTFFFQPFSIAATCSQPLFGAGLGICPNMPAGNVVYRMTGSATYACSGGPTELRLFIEASPDDTGVAVAMGNGGPYELAGVSQAPNGDGESVTARMLAQDCWGDECAATFTGHSMTISVAP